MDLAESVAPRSDQLNADDLLPGPQTFTVERAESVAAEGRKKLIVHLVETPGRPYKPSLNMGRVLIKVWGRDSTAWPGKRLTLYRDDKVKFGPETLGGIRISHVSHIERRTLAPITPAKGKRGTWTVEPLPEAPSPEPATEPWRAQWQAITNALTEAGYEGDGPAMLATAGQVIGTTWEHPNRISPEDAQKILAAVREDNHQEPTE